MRDLNSPDVPDEYRERYDYILDGWTLEHVFNLPNALEAVFKMLKVGVTFFLDSPAYDGINHGFYNISPCLYHEYFSVNKYRINSIYDIKIHDISTVKPRDTIIISSRIYQDIIYDRIKHLENEGVAIVKLY